MTQDFLPSLATVSRAGCLLTGITVLMALGACSGNADYLPLAAGRWSVYAIDNTILDEHHPSRYVELHLGPSRLDGQTVFTRRSQTASLDYVQVGADGVERVAARTRGSASVRYDEPPRQLLPADLNSTMHWQVVSTLGLIESRTFARGDRIIPRRYPVQITKSVGALDETVSVPAGVFTGCVRIDGQGQAVVPTDRRNATATVTVTTHEWYARGVGMVRLERDESSPSTFLKPGRQVWALLDYGD